MEKPSTPPFTDRAIKALPNAAGFILRDDVVPGLHVKSALNHKSFFLWFRTKEGVERRPKLGNCGALTISQARDIARGILLRVAQGHDPARERVERRLKPTMDDLWQLCEKEHWNRERQWDREVKRLYDVHIKPRIGSIKIRDIRYRDVDGLRSALIGTPNQANRTIAVLSKMLNLAERLEMRPLGSNPCQQIPRFKERGRQRYATPEEIARIGPLLEAEAVQNPAAVAFLYLLLFSGARPSEIARATWDQLDENVLRIPDGKSGHRDLFLSLQAMAIINHLPKNKGTITGLRAVPRKVWGRIREAAGCPDLYARDLRRTFATVGLSNGVPIGMVGELLGHQSAQTTKIYAKLMEEPAKEAASSIGNKIEEMLTST